MGHDRTLRLLGTLGLPTEPMRRWLSDPTTYLNPQSRAKFPMSLLTAVVTAVAIAMSWGGRTSAHGILALRAARSRHDVCPCRQMACSGNGDRHYEW